MIGCAAIILVGLMVHGLRPGAYLFTEQVDKVYQNVPSFILMQCKNLYFVSIRNCRV